MRTRSVRRRQKELSLFVGKDRGLALENGNWGSYSGARD